MKQIDAGPQAGSAKTTWSAKVAAPGTVARLCIWLGDRPVASGSLILTVALAVPLGLDGYLVYLTNLALVYAVTAMGFTIVLGWTGLLGLCNSAFFGLGAYTGGLVAARWGVPVEAAILAGALAGGLVGLAFGSLAVRLRRYYLAITAIAFMFVLDYFFRNLDEITGGVRGLVIPAPTFALLGFQQVSSSYGHYYFSLLMVVVVYLFAVRLRKSSLGREWQVVRADERVAMALGINVYLSKLKAFVIGFAVIAASGAWLGFLLGRIFPESFLGNEMMYQFLIVALGGLGSVNGAVGGAIFLIVVRQYLRGYVGISEILFGVLLLVTVLALPRGIYGTLAEKYRGLREGFL